MYISFYIFCRLYLKMVLMKSFNIKEYIKFLKKVS